MTNKGFYIKSLVASGKEVKETRIDFKKRCNLVFGRSNCGKSHILNLMEFLLGMNDDPKQMKEGQGYDIFYLEIATYLEDEIFTIQRKLGENYVVVKPVGFSEFHKEIKGLNYTIKSRKGKEETSFSSFLLNLSGFDVRKELKTKTTEKQTLTYSYIRHLILTSENHIISENSIFFPTEQHTNVTGEKSFIYYLTTGEDDSNFIPEEKPEIQRANIKGKIFIIEELIKAKEEEIKKLGNNRFADFHDESFYTKYKENFEIIEQKLNSNFINIKELEEKRSELLSRELFLKAFLNRLRLLKNHYEVDLARYDFIFQGEQLFQTLDNILYCPVCKSQMKVENVDPEIKNSIVAEVSDIHKRIKEAGEMICKQEGEIAEVNSKIMNLTNEIKDLSTKSKNLTLKFEDLKEILQRYQQNIEINSRNISLGQEIENLKEISCKLAEELKSISINKSKNERVANITEEFCKSLETKLREWRIKDVSPIKFDEKKFDFIIGGKDRLTCGKGERGVTCTAILMTLVEYCIKHNIPFTRTLVVDSPITAHFTSEPSNPDEITQSSFFKYCNDNIHDYQLSRWSN